jgi:predicted DNA-binding protein
MTDKRLNARIDDELDRKLGRLRRLTQKSTTEIIKTAIERYYEDVFKQRRAYDVLAEVGFIGGHDGPSDLSLRVKEELDYERKS